MAGTAPFRPDVLAGLSERQRRERENKDIKYLAHTADIDKFADPLSLKRDGNTWAGATHGLFGPHNLRPYDGSKPDFVVCVRYDLEHPLLFSDNLATDCSHCGCNLQARPDCPAGPRMCVCCAARHHREQVKSNDDDNS